MASQRVAAALLREIVGNPFRRWFAESRTCPSAHCGKPTRFHDTPEYVSGQWDCTGCTRIDRADEDFTAAWRAGRVLRRELLTPTVLSLAEAAYEERGRKCYRCGGNKTNRVAVNRDHTKHQDMPCSDCNGTGTIDDGTLDNDRLAVLSDALEEAGCDDEAILSHLRTTPTDEHSPRCGTAFRGCAPECPKDRAERQGPHVRGCWAIDLILGLGRE